MSRGRTEPRLIVVGPGRLGRALARAHAATGAPVLLVGRQAGFASSFAAHSGVETAQLDADGSLPAAAAAAPWHGSLVLLALPDDALAAAATAWADHSQPSLLLHASGLAGLEIFPDAGPTAALHPLRAFAGDEAPEELRGTPATLLASSTAAREQAETLAAAWGFRTLLFEPGADRRHYHLACCLVANHWTGLFAWAEELATPALGRESARAALAALGQSALEGVSALGPGSALSGPVARADLGTLAAHLESLSAGEQTRYRRLLAELIQQTRALGRLAEAQARELEAALELPVEEGPK